MKTLHLSRRLVLSLSILSICSLHFTPAPQAPQSADDLEGAWKMVLNRNQSMEDLNLNMVKILVDGHFMFAFYNEDEQVFYSCGGGEYDYKDGVYTEKIQFHTIDPELVGRALDFDARMEDNRWYHTGDIDGQEMNEVFERFEGNASEMLMGAWKIHASGMSQDNLEVVRKKHPQTWKLIAGDRYSWATFDAKTGALESCGGGMISAEDNWCREQVAYNSQDSLLVGKVIRYQGMPLDDDWQVSMPLTRGGESGEVVRWKRMD